MAWCLEKLAKINILQALRKPGARSIENYRHAVQLFAAAAALRAPVGSVIDEADQADYKRDLASLQKELGKDLFSKLWFETETMLLEDIIAGELTESSKESKNFEDEKFDGLTAREREVVVLISQGKSNREIANTLIVGQKTVETYVTRILNKLGFASRVQIAIWVMERRELLPGKS